MKIRPVVAKLFYADDRWADRWTVG